MLFKTIFRQYNFIEIISYAVCCNGWQQTCQPLITENLETQEKKSGDSTKSSEIQFFPFQIKRHGHSCNKMPLFFFFDDFEDWDEGITGTKVTARGRSIPDKQLHRQSVSHLPKKFLQVSQIFTKQSKGN